MRFHAFRDDSAVHRADGRPLMQALFGREGEQALRTLVGVPTLFGFDFDGTLAPIVARPDDARVTSAIARALVRLAARAPVAVVTGRAVADVWPRLGFEPAFVVGNHGAEDPMFPPTPAAAAAFDALRQRLTAEAPALAAAGVAIEDKTFSFALHYRLARDAAQAQQAIDALVAGLDPRFRTFGGKAVLNIVAADAPDKADAMFELVARAHCEAALFVGDDVNDEAVFERAPPSWVTVRVGLDERAETHARFFLDGQASLAPMLQRLLTLLP